MNRKISTENWKKNQLMPHFKEWNSRLLLNFCLLTSKSDTRGTISDIEASVAEDERSFGF